MHGYEKKYVDTTDVVMRNCFEKISEICQYILQKDKDIKKEIDKINSLLSKPFDNIKVNNWMMEKYFEEYGHELEIQIKTKDKKTYFMAEEDYLKLYKLVKKFDGYNRKAVIEFMDIRTKEKVTLCQQDIKSYKVK